MMPSDKLLPFIRCYPRRRADQILDLSTIEVHVTPEPVEDIGPPLMTCLPASQQVLPDNSSPRRVRSIKAEFEVHTGSEGWVEEFDPVGREGRNAFVVFQQTQENY